MSERAMVHVEYINKITPIDGADSIETAHVLGWECVVKKDEFKVGDKIAYFEIDSWIPIERVGFLRKDGKQRFYNGVDGEKLKTVRLRKQISQGLVLKLPDDVTDSEVGTDLTEYFGVQKWEMEIPQCLAGKIRGSFPSEIQKTDQPRVQNVFDKIQYQVKNGEIVDEWIVQEKLEGSSMQVAIINGETHVLSRNCDLKLDDESNTFVKVAKETKLLELIEHLDEVLNVNCVSLQGELIGEGIQGNIYNIKGNEFRLFDIWSTKHHAISDLIEVQKIAKQLDIDLKMVPIHKGVISGLFSDESSVQYILKLATIKSSLNPSQDAEGLVFKNVYDPNISFKAINPEYLLKQK